MSKLDDIIYCTTGCASNADPADGFGYCTCGTENQRKEIKDLVLNLIKESYYGQDFAVSVLERKVKEL